MALKSTDLETLTMQNMKESSGGNYTQLLTINFRQVTRLQPLIFKNQFSYKGFYEKGQKSMFSSLKYESHQK